MSTALTDCHLPERSVLELEGLDRVPFLNGLVSNEISDRPVYAAFLSPQGRILHGVFILPQEECILLDVESKDAQNILTLLSRYRLRSKVEFSLTSSAVIASPEEKPGGYRDPRLPALGWRSVSASTSLPEGTESYARHCHALGLPASLPSGLLPHEANLDLLNGISFSKGCYIGQELTARIQHRNLVKKRLFAVSGPAAEAAGPIYAGEKEAGTLSGDFALLRMELARQPLTVSSLPLNVFWPDWMPQ